MSNQLSGLTFTAGPAEQPKLEISTVIVSVRLQLHGLAYNLANFLRTPTLPEAVSHLSMPTLRDLVKIGAKVVRQRRLITFSDGRVTISRGLFQRILDAIAALRPLPPARC